METEYCPKCGNKTLRLKQFCYYDPPKTTGSVAICIGCKYGGTFGTISQIDDVETLRTTALKMEREKGK